MMQQGATLASTRTTEQQFEGGVVVVVVVVVVVDLIGPQLHYRRPKTHMSSDWHTTSVHLAREYLGTTSEE